jgi:hypothetical protein
MKVLVEKQQLANVEQTLRRVFSDQVELEVFDLRKASGHSVVPIEAGRHCIYIFSDGIFLDEEWLTMLGDEIAERPDDINVAVRYNEIAESLRSCGIHADISGMNPTIDSIYRAIVEFIGVDNIPTIILVGGKTSWTESLGSLMRSKGFEIEDHSSDCVDARLRILFESDAFDAVSVDQMVEVEALERVSGLTIEEISRSIAIKSRNPDLVLMFRRRGIVSQLFS